MAGDDELERLLREVDASLSGGSTSPAKRPDAQPAARPGASPAEAGPGRFGPAVRTGAVAGAVCGVGVGATAFFLSWLPMDQNPLSTGFGAFLGAFLTGAVLSLRKPG